VNSPQVLLAARDGKIVAQEKHVLDLQANAMKFLDDDGIVLKDVEVGHDYMMRTQRLSFSTQSVKNITIYYSDRGSV
jgi:hypothetical protein